MKPFDININDNSSTTSTLTDKSDESKVSVLSGGSLGTINSEDLTVGTKESKYGISNSMIEKIAKEGFKNGITAEELALQVQQYQALKFNEAKLATAAAVEKFILSSGNKFAQAKNAESTTLNDEENTSMDNKKLVENAETSKPNGSNSAGSELKDPPETGDDNQPQSGTQESDKVDSTNKDVNETENKFSAVVSPGADNKSQSNSLLPSTDTASVTSNNEDNSASSDPQQDNQLSNQSHLTKKPPNPPTRRQPKRSTSIPNYILSAGGAKSGRTS